MPDVNDPSFLQRCTTFLADNTGRMEGLRASLSGLVRDREQDFLALGETLQQVSAQAATLSGHARDLADSMAGEETKEARTGLARHLQELAALCDSSINEHNLQELDNVLRTLEKLDSLIHNFKRIVRSLEMLGISTRIESARLGYGGRGFETLSDDVEGLAHAIVSDSASILDKSRTLVHLASSARNRTIEMRTTQAESSAFVVSTIQGDLDDLDRLVGRSRETSASLVELSHSIGRHLGEVVASMQFHDIVRQQVEHVEETLTETLLVGREHRDSSGGQPQATVDAVGWFGDITELQASQLGNARERFFNAVEALKKNLLRVAADVGAFSQRVSESVGFEEGGGTLGRIERSIANLLVRMRGFEKQAESIGEVMASVAATVIEISSFLNRIEEVGEEIELIALNASIKAAHTGEKGAALGVLASAIQRLSSEACQLTDSIAAVLGTISQSAEVLNANAKTMLDSRQMDDVIARLEELTARLRTFDDSARTRFQALKADGETLSNSIGQCEGRIDFHLATAAGLDEARDIARDIARKARALIPNSSASRRPERLRRLLERYTMEVERLVHSATSRPDKGSTRAKPTLAAADTGNDLGDNVELF